MKTHYDAILVGAGLYNAVLATRLIKKHKNVLVIEKRNHIGGNCYTENKDNIDIHTYGPHVFHTDNIDVWNFVNQYTKFNTFQLNTMATAEGKVYNLPFNMNTFNQLFDATTPEEAQEAILKDKMKELMYLPTTLEEQATAMVGRTIFKKFIKGYTEKQWGKKCSELPAEIIKRIPLRFTYNNNYFNDRFQGIPAKGYTEMIGNMFTETNGKYKCDFLYNEDFLVNKEKWEAMTDKVYFSGCIDEYYDYCFGELEYRGLKFETKRIETENYQGCPVMNYTTHEKPFTRVIEHKWFCPNRKSDVTYVTEEYPSTWKRGDIPYYPVNTSRNQELYQKYKDIPNKKVVFTGRCGLYKYNDMDDTVEQALNLAL